VFTCPGTDAKDSSIWRIEKSAHFQFAWVFTSKKYGRQLACSSTSCFTDCNAPIGSESFRMEFVFGELAFLQMWTVHMSLSPEIKTGLNAEMSKSKSSGKIITAMPENNIDGADFGDTAVLFALIFYIGMTYHLLLDALSSVDVGNRFPSRTLYPPTSALSDVSLNFTFHDNFGNIPSPLNRTTSMFVNIVFIFAAFSVGLLLGNRVQRFLSPIFSLPVNFLDAYFIRVMKKYKLESS
jgi:hypothetical protein